MPKKAPAKKPVPKALQKLVKQAKASEEPYVDVITAKGIGSVPSEVGAGSSPLLMTANDGAAKQISLATPFGRPALEPGQAAPIARDPLLQPENTRKPIAAGEDFDNAWDTIAKETVATVDTIAMEDEEEADPFGVAEAVEELKEEGSIDPIGEAISAMSVIPESLLEEMADLRKTNQLLRGLNDELIAKNGWQKVLAERDALKKALKDAGAQGGGRTITITELPKWPSKDLRVSCPFHKFTNPATAFAMIALALDYGPERIGFLPALGDARIANSRNRLSTMFMDTNAPWLLMLDDDIIPTVGRPQFTRDFIGATQEEVPDKVLAVHVVQRLMESAQNGGRKLIGATYFGRRKYSPAMFKEGIDNPAAYQAAKSVSGQVMATEWVATGCMLIHRDVFTAIQNTHPELAPNQERANWDYFQEGVGESGGEDVMFCKRARKAGIQPYVDTGAQCFHVGLQAFGFHNTENKMVRPSGVNSTERKWW